MQLILLTLAIHDVSPHENQPGCDIKILTTSAVFGALECLEKLDCVQEI